MFGSRAVSVLTVAWLYLFRVGGELTYQGCPWVYEAVLTGDIVFLPLLGKLLVHVRFNLGLSVLDCQLMVVFASGVHCHIFGSGTLLLYAVFCFCLCSYAVSPS